MPRDNSDSQPQNGQTQNGPWAKDKAGNLIVRPVLGYQLGAMNSEKMVLIQFELEGGPVQVMLPAAYAVSLADGLVLAAYEAGHTPTHKNNPDKKQLH